MKTEASGSKHERGAGSRKKAAGRRRAFRFLPRENYPPYRTGPKEDLIFSGAGTLAGILLGLLFYRRAEGLLLALPAGYILLRLGRRKTAAKRKERLKSQLRDYLVSVVSFLRAGYALENAMSGAEKEIGTMHGADSLMGREAARMSSRLLLQIPPEQLWREFGDRTELPEGQRLAKVFAVAKRQGGDYLPVLKAMVRMMDENLSLKAEIAALLAGRRLEYYIMCLIPAGMLVYLNLSTPEMLLPLFDGSGPWLMSLFLLLYAAAVLAGDRILEKSHEA